MSNDVFLDHLTGVLLVIAPPEVVVVPDVLLVAPLDVLVDRFCDGAILCGVGIFLTGGSVGRSRIGSVGLVTGTAVTRPAVDSVG